MNMKYYKKYWLEINDNKTTLKIIKKNIENNAYNFI